MSRIHQNGPAPTLSALRAQLESVTATEGDRHTGPLDIPKVVQPTLGGTRYQAGALSLDRLENVESLLAFASLLPVLESMALHRDGWATSDRLGMSLGTRQAQVYRDLMSRDAAAGLARVYAPNSAPEEADLNQGTPAVVYGAALRRGLRGVTEEGARSTGESVRKTGESVRNAARSTRSEAGALSGRIRDSVSKRLPVSRIAGAADESARAASQLQPKVVDRIARQAANKKLQALGLKPRLRGSQTSLAGLGLSPAQRQAVGEAQERAVAQLRAHPPGLKPTRMRASAFRRGVNGFLKRVGSKTRVRPGQSLESLVGKGGISPRLQALARQAGFREMDGFGHKMKGRVEANLAGIKGDFRKAAGIARKNGLPGLSRQWRNATRQTEAIRAKLPASPVRAPKPKPKSPAMAHGAGRALHGHSKRLRQGAEQFAKTTAKSTRHVAAQGRNTARAVRHAVDEGGAAISNAASAGRVAKGLRGLGKIALPVGIALDAFDFSAAAAADESRADGRHTEKKKAGGRIAGGWIGGALAGAAAGTMGFPVVGTILGAVAGGIVGATAGEAMMSEL